MTQKISRIIIAVFAIMVGLYPVVYFMIDRKFGLLGSKSDELLSNTLWNTGFYTHIILGGLALLIGWLQFNTKLRIKNIFLHRNIGKVYIVAALISSLAGMGIGLFATGGIIPAIGFTCLGIIWFTTTLLAYQKIRNLKNRDVEQHRRLMIYSYAACFSAVTLRIWLPLLIMMFGDFIIAYKIVAWLCWVPNILVAALIVSKLSPVQYSLSPGSIKEKAL